MREVHARVRPGPHREPGAVEPGLRARAAVLVRGADHRVGGLQDGRDVAVRGGGRWDRGPAAGGAAAAAGGVLGGCGLRRERVVVLAVELLVQVARLGHPRLDLVLLRGQGVDDALALLGRRGQLGGGPAGLLLGGLGLDRQVGIGLRHAADELEAIGEVRQRGRVEQLGDLRADAPVGPGGVRVQAVRGSVGRRLGPLRLGPNVGQPGLHLLEPDPCLVVLLDHLVELLVQGVQACLGLLDLFTARGRGGEGCGTDRRRTGEEHDERSAVRRGACVFRSSSSGQENGLPYDSPRTRLPDSRASGNTTRQVVDPSPRSRGLVGTAGLEPATSASRTLRATKLRHVPSCPSLSAGPVRGPPVASTDVAEGRAKGREGGMP